MNNKKLYDELVVAQSELKEIDRLLCRVSTQHRRLSYRINQLKRQVSKEMKEQLNFN